MALGPVLADPSGLVGLNATHVPATPRPVSSSDLPLELGLRHRVACSALVSPPQRPAAATHSLFELSCASRSCSSLFPRSLPRPPRPAVSGACRLRPHSLPYAARLILSPLPRAQSRQPPSFV